VGKARLQIKRSGIYLDFIGVVTYSENLKKIYKGDYRRKILKLLKRQGVRMWNKFIWLRVGTYDGLL